MTDSSFSEAAGSGLPGLAAQATDAAAALASLKAPAEAAADAIDKAFGRAGQSLARSLARAASDGRLSLSELASAVIGAADAFAKSSGGGGGTLGDALAAALGGLFGGARADGGPVAPGGAYLVGERGPEVFRPASAGVVEPGGAGPGVVVNVSLAGGGAPALLRSEAQIAAALARAVALGRR